MNKSFIINILDNVLCKNQFSRHHLTWTRHFPEFIDVIDLQVSKSFSKFSINVGIIDKFVFEAVWGTIINQKISDESCTVRRRLSYLTSGVDLWLDLDEKLDVTKLLSDIENFALEFLTRNRSIDRLMDLLQEISPPKYPPESIYLAILNLEKKNFSIYKNQIQFIKKSTFGSWNLKVNDIDLHLKKEFPSIR